MKKQLARRAFTYDVMDLFMLLRSERNWCKVLSRIMKSGRKRALKLGRNIAGIVAILSLFLCPFLFAETWEKTNRLTWNSGESEEQKIAADSYNPSIGTDVKNNIHIFWDEYSTHPDIDNYEIYYKKGKQ